MMETPVKETQDAPPVEAAEGGDRVEGEVKWFDVKKGFGFVAGPAGEDVFVHFSAITGDGFRALKDGEKVTYEMSQGDKGFHAIDVRRVNPLPEEGADDEAPKPAAKRPEKKERRQKRAPVRRELNGRNDRGPKPTHKENFPQEKPTTVGRRETDLYHGLPQDDEDGGFVG